MLAGLYGGLSGNKAGTKLQRHATTSGYSEKVIERIKVTTRYYTNITQPIHMSPSLIAKKQCKGTHTVDKFY